jgi:hypothetical protein
MPLVSFTVTFGDETTPRILPAAARAVPAELYTGIEDEAGNPGGITRGDLADGDVRGLGDFEDGHDVYVEGDPEDVLDDTDDETSMVSRIWWRATIVER